MPDTITASEFLAMNKNAVDTPDQISAEQYRNKYVPKHTVLDEHQQQAALVKWFAGHFPQYLFFAIPNGGKLPYKKAISKKTGKSISISPERTKLLAEGMVPGIPDLFLPVARGGYHGLFIEMKTEKGTLSPEQKAIHPRLTNEDYMVVVAYGLEAAKTFIIDYLSLQPL